jgi:hypothetical protein
MFSTVGFSGPQTVDCQIRFGSKEQDHGTLSFASDYAARFDILDMAIPNAVAPSAFINVGCCA